MDIGVTGVVKRRRGFGGQCSVPFDGKNLASDLGQNGGGIARPGADLEHLFTALETQPLDHVGHDEGLRDGLVRVDGQRAVGISLAFQAVRHETLARHASHRIQNQRITYPARADLAFDHLRAKILIIRHVTSPFWVTLECRMAADRGYPRAAVCPVRLWVGTSGGGPGGTSPGGCGTSGGISGGISPGGSGYSSGGFGGLSFGGATGSSGGAGSGVAGSGGSPSKPSVSPFCRGDSDFIAMKSAFPCQIRRNPEANAGSHALITVKRFALRSLRGHPRATLRSSLPHSGDVPPRNKVSEPVRGTGTPHGALPHAAVAAQVDPSRRLRCLEQPHHAAFRACRVSGARPTPGDLGCRSFMR